MHFVCVFFLSSQTIQQTENEEKFYEYYCFLLISKIRYILLNEKYTQLIFVLTEQLQSILLWKNNFW